jgi:SAM-dependent methyltransferase
VRIAIPWWTRIGAKIVLSRLPAGYATWRRLRLFTHGAMHDADYALSVFAQHFARSGLSVGQPFVAAEFGPGDSLSSAVIAAAHGATHTHLVDAGAYATTDLAVYRNIAEKLRAMGLNPPDLNGVNDVAGLLRACSASYGTRGLDSLREIRSGSVDFAWSHAVLEHVRRHEFKDFICETRRILAPNGIASHQIDLRDHLGGGLNNLRIPTRTWEANWFANSGFYTNRLSKQEILQSFEEAQFDVGMISELRWDTLPIQVSSMASEFQNDPPGSRLVRIFDILARPKARA